MITNNSNLVDPISNLDNQDLNSLIHRINNNVINRIIIEVMNIPISNRGLNTRSNIYSTTDTRVPSPTYYADSEISDDEDYDNYYNYENLENCVNSEDNYDTYENYEDCENHEDNEYNHENYEDNLEQDSNSSTISTTDSEDSYTDSISERSYCGTPEGYQSWSGSENGYEDHHNYDDY